MEPISKIDSSTNQLFFRGISATKLAVESNYETVVYLLLFGNLPSTQEYEKTKSKMIEFRDLYTEDMVSMKALVEKFDLLKNEYVLSLKDRLIAFISLSALVTARSYRREHGLDEVYQNSDLCHTDNFLWMSTGKEISEPDSSDFETCQILHMDDPDNPSLTALTGIINDGQSVSKGLLGALAKHVGRLHHGAGTEAMKMYFEARGKPDLREYLSQRIGNGDKIFGLGHRIYRGFDPRARVLREMLYRRAINTEQSWLVELIENISKIGSEVLLDGKGIQAYPNVDLYNAATYTTFGFTSEFNTSLFALSRTAGWSAHILELLEG